MQLCGHLIYNLFIGSSKIIRLREENSETSEILKGKSSGNGASVPVKGINNLGNTCFFNAVMQVSWKGHASFSSQISEILSLYNLWTSEKVLSIVNLHSSF